MVAITTLPRRQIFDSAVNSHAAVKDLDRHSNQATQLLSWRSEPLALRDRSRTFGFAIDVQRERLQVPSALYPLGHQSNLRRRKWLPFAPFSPPLLWKSSRSAIAFWWIKQIEDCVCGTFLRSVTALTTAHVKNAVESLHAAEIAACCFNLHSICVVFVVHLIMSLIFFDTFILTRTVWRLYTLF